jgi:hypothetical protein
MRTAFLSIRSRLDRVGIVLSGLCLIHCLAGLFLVALLGLGGGWLLAPEIHRVGLGLAILVGLLTIGLGALRHGKGGPLALASLGMALMGMALVVGHGVGEAAFTVGGVALVAWAHILNLRHSR